MLAELLQQDPALETVVVDQLTEALAKDPLRVTTVHHDARDEWAGAVVLGREHFPHPDIREDRGPGGFV